MKDLETVIRQVVDAKAEQNNQIDLHAYENGMRDFAKAINYSQCCKSDSELLPTKRYEIDFGGDLKCGIDITNNELNVVGAMNGWGNGVPKESIHITEI